MLKPDRPWPGLAVIAGLSIGAIKARYLFSSVCRKNLDRIASLKRPRVWQFYRLRFFALLGVAIIFGATLSRLAHDNYPFLMAVAILDLSIATALLGSSHVFWQQKAFADGGGHPR